MTLSEVKVIQIGMNMYSLVVSIIKPSLKEIGSQVSEWRPVKMKSSRYKNLMNIDQIKDIVMSLNMAAHGSQPNFIHIDCEIWKKMSAEVLLSHKAVAWNEGQGHSN